MKWAVLSAQLLAVSLSRLRSKAGPGWQGAVSGYGDFTPSGQNENAVLGSLNNGSKFIAVKAQRGSLQPSKLTCRVTQTMQFELVTLLHTALSIFLSIYLFLIFFFSQGGPRCPPKRKVNNSSQDSLPTLQEAALVAMLSRHPTAGQTTANTNLSVCFWKKIKSKNRKSLSIIDKTVDSPM